MVSHELALPATCSLGRRLQHLQVGGKAGDVGNIS